MFFRTPKDFELLATAIVELTSPNTSKKVIISDLPFVRFEKEKIKITFAAKRHANSLAGLVDNEFIFELDSSYWDRIFIFFALMSWDQKTYYLNSNEDCLIDLKLEQGCNFICSSEFSRV